MHGRPVHRGRMCYMPWDMPYNGIKVVKPIFSKSGRESRNNSKSVPMEVSNSNVDDTGLGKLKHNVIKMIIINP